MRDIETMADVARRAGELQQKINDAGMGPPSATQATACPNCVALESEVARLRELAAAAKAFLDRDRLEGGYESWNQALSDLQDAVGRVDAEAGEAR